MSPTPEFAHDHDVRLYQGAQELFPALVEGTIGYAPMVVLAEIFVVVVEAAWLAHRGVRQPVAWSTAANAASLAGGLGSRHLLGWP